MIVKPEYKYDKAILALQEMAGFYDYYCRMLSYYSTNEEAYEAVERVFESHYDRRRYKNFETFKVSLSRWLGKR